jgi:hypothetical protein
MDAALPRDAAFNLEKEEFLLWQDIQMLFVDYAAEKAKSFS